MYLFGSTTLLRNCIRREATRILFQQIASCFRNLEKQRTHTLQNDLKLGVIHDSLQKSTFVLAVKWRFSGYWFLFRKPNNRAFWQNGGSTAPETQGTLQPRLWV